MATTVEVFFAALWGTIAFLAAGHWIGRRVAKTGVGASLGLTASAHLGLLAFMLTFTFGFAASRVAERKTLVIDESNAIGTAGLRASYLPEARARRILSLMIEYTELRAVLLPEQKVDYPTAEARSTTLTRALWKETREAVIEGKPSEPAVTLFAASMNELIDTGAKRATVVFVHRIPPAIWVALGLIGALGMGMLGFHSGIDGARRPMAALPLGVSLAIVVALIINMDSPYGLIRLGQKPMLDTLAMLRELQAR